MSVLNRSSIMYVRDCLSSENDGVEAARPQISSPTTQHNVASVLSKLISIPKVEEYR